MRKSSIALSQSLDYYVVVPRTGTVMIVMALNGRRDTLVQNICRSSVSCCGRGGNCLVGIEGRRCTFFSSPHKVQPQQQMYLTPTDINVSGM